MSHSQVPISTPRQRRLWTASRALCLFVFCKKRTTNPAVPEHPRLFDMWKPNSGTAPCSAGTQMCVCVRECVGGARCLNRAQISDSFFLFLINKPQCMLGYVREENNMPLANQKQVVGLGGYRPCSSYHKTTALLTLIVVVDRFWGFGLEVFYYFGLESKQQKCNYVKSRQQFGCNGRRPSLWLNSLIRVPPHTVRQR